MKKISTIVLAVITTLTVFGQNFEGEITYKNSFKSKEPSIKDDQFNMIMGTKQEYYIKGGNYKSITNGTVSQWQIYLAKENKIYFKMSSTQSIFWNDASVNGDAVLKTVFNKGVIEILGYKCDELILTCKSGTQKYYFNSKLGVDPKLFVNHKFGNFYSFVEISKAVPLKMIIDNEKFTLENIATEIKPMKLSDKDFQLPIGVKVEKSPY